MSLHGEGLLHHLHHHSTYSSIFLTRLSHHPCKRRSSFPDVVNQAPSCSALFPLIVFFGSILFNRCVHMLSWHLARWPAHLYFFVFISCMMSLAFVFFRKTSFLWPRLTSTMTLSVTFSVTQVSFPNSAVLFASVWLRLAYGIGIPSSCVLSSLSTLWILKGVNFALD